MSIKYRQHFIFVETILYRLYKSKMTAFPFQKIKRITYI